MSTQGWRAVGRAVAGLAALTVLLVGVPVALATLAGWPLPRRVPDPAAVGRFLSSRAELPPDVVFKALALVGWAAWVEMAAATVVELVAFARSSHAPRLPLPLAGPVQSVAASLVAAAAMVLLPLRVPTSPAVPLTSLPFVHAAAVTQVEAAPPATATAATPEQSPAAPAREAAYTVKPGDWLSRIARTHLGAAQRWPEIYEVNKGRPQPDGRALRDPDLIRPGWHLVLPARAPGSSETAAEAPAAPARPLQPAAGPTATAKSDSNGGPASPRKAPAPPASPDEAPVPTTAAKSPSNEPRTSPEAATPTSPGASVSTVEAPSNGLAPSPDAAPPSTGPDPWPATGGTDKLTTPTPAPPAVVPSGPLVQDPATPASSGPQAAGPPVQATDSAAPTPSVARPRTDETQGVPDRRVMAMAFAGLLTGGALLRLRKLRANQQRLRRRGRDIPRPPVDLQDAEAHLRSIADEDAPRWVDAVSRSLSSVLHDLDPDSIPRIVAVRIGGYGAELLLDGPHPNAAGAFRPADADRVWRLDPAVGLEDLEALAEGQPAALPALLAVGETSEGPVLLDLERAGTLAVEGDPDRVSAFLAGAALQLAAAPWATDVPLQMAGGDPALIALDGVEIVDAAVLERRFSHADIAEPRPVAHHPLADRVRPGAGEHFAPTAIVVAPGAAPDETLTMLAGRAQPGSGVVLVAPGSIDGALWRLRIEADGSARLEPTGIDLTSGVSASHVHDLAALLAQAADEDDVALVVDLPPTVSGIEGEPELWVRVLGPVEVDWPGKPPRPRSAELVVYLATHDERPVPGDRLRVALWPGDEEVAGATLLSTVSRARGALGEDHQGLPHLPDAEGGCYRLRPGVGCDWQRFRNLTAQARHAADAEATELLREALGLVRGVPFADPPKGAYGWALAELVSIIEVTVAEAAERLGDLALAAGDAELAVWSARQGLLACPGREALYQLIMRAFDLAGDPDGVEAAWRELRRAVRAIDPLEEPRPDTVALYESLTRRDRPVGGPPLKAMGHAAR